MGKHITNGAASNGLELPGEQKEAQAWEYWGSRLLNLYEELENEKPHGAWDAWVERYSKSRHAMFATIVGILVAIALGMVSLVVAVVQTWISYKAWKTPVS